MQLCFCCPRSSPPIHNRDIYTTYARILQLSCSKYELQKKGFSDEFPSKQRAEKVKKEEGNEGGGHKNELKCGYD